MKWHNNNPSDMKDVEDKNGPCVSVREGRGQGACGRRRSAGG